jgi:hypothetical protein
MKLFVGVLATALVGASVGSANADTISIGWNNKAGPGIQTLTTGSPSTPLIFNGSIDGFSLNIALAEDPVPIHLDGETLDFSSGGKALGPLYLYVSETGITMPPGQLSFLSGLTENELPRGWTMTESTFLGPANVTYGRGAPLDSFTFTSIGSQDLTAGATVPSTPFSVTELFILTTNKTKGTDESSISLTSSVIPEASTWSMLGIGLAGLALAGAARGRRAGSRYAL